MKLSLFLFATLFSCSVAMAGHREGYIVTLAGDTQHVFIRLHIDVERDYREVMVVDSEDHKVHTYEATELQGYGYREKKFEYHLRQMPDADSTPVLAMVDMLGPKVNAYTYWQKTCLGCPVYSNIIMQRRDGARLIVSRGGGLGRLKKRLTDFFGDDSQATAWIPHHFKDWSWATVGQDLQRLLQIYNGWVPGG